MKKVILSASELENFKVYCLNELSKAKSRTMQMEDILNALSSDNPEVVVGIESSDEISTKSVDESISNESLIPKKYTHLKKTLKWNEFILNTITKNETVMTANEIIKSAYAELNVSEADKQKVRLSISSILNHMLNIDKVIKAHAVEGVRGRFYGLSTWFNENGLLNKRVKTKLSVQHQ